MQSFILVLVNDGDGLRLQDATNTSMCLDADGEYIAVFTPCADTDTQRFQIQVVNDTTDQVTVALVNMRYKTHCLKEFNETERGRTPPFFYWDEEACTADPFVWEVETECTNVPGYTVIPYADSTAQPNLRVNGLPPKPPFLPTLPYLLSLANICAQDCRCTHITSYGAGKSLGPLAPLNAAGWNRCLYQRTKPASCCPDVPGYNKTEGVVADWGVYKSLDPLVPGSQQPSAANQPWTVGMITPLANTCAGDCQCVAFSNGVSPNLYNDTYLTAPIDPTVIRAATTDRCIYTASPPVCASDPALYASRIRFRNAIKWPDRCIFNENGVVGFSMGNPEYCPSDKTSAFKLVPADDGSGAATIQEDGGRCLGVTQVKGKPATLLGPLQVQNCVSGAPHQQFLIRKIDDGRYEIVAYTDRTKCLVADDFAPDGVVVMGTCGVGDLDMQRFQIDVETACPLMDGYDAVGARTLRRALKNFLEVSDSKDRDTVAKECMTNCKCTAFSFVTGAIPRNGILWTSSEFPEFTAGVGECYYMKQQITPCTCPAVTSFSFKVAVDGPSTGNIMTLDPVPSIPEIGGACLADCKCKSFNSNGVLKTTITSSPVADRGLCFYSRIGTPDCSVKCPETNLACLTSKIPALQLPKFPVNLPQLPFPDNSGDVLDTLDPPTLVTYVAKFASGSGGGDLTSRFGCPGALLPIFKGSSIGDNKALDTLSGGACGKMKPLPDNSYIVGAISTAAADFVTSLGGLKADKANKAKKDGKDYGICAAVDPCSRDLHLGFVGLSVKLGLGLGPLTPPTLTITLKSVSYSDSGNGAGIAKTSLGLWTYNDKVDTVNNGVAIMGNVYMSVGAVLTWGFQAGSVKVCTITLSADVQIVTRSHNPTRFAMQIAAKPTIDLFPGGGFIVDLKKVVDSLSIDVLFYVEHYNDNKYNVYVAVNVRSDLQTLLSAFAGPLGQVLKELVSSQSNLNVLMNIHMDPRGAGIRLYFTGQIALGGKIGGFITKFIPQAKITFTAGLGAKLSIVQVKGRKKVFGSVFIQGNEFSFAPCSDNLDCMSDQVCYTGFCAKKMGCLATRPIDIGDTLGSAFGGLFSSGGPKVKTCPKGLDNFNGLFCRVRNCPKDFPQFCNNGIFGSCVKLGVECSFDKILASLFGNCPGI